ncbi:SIS domain-containing protein [bacterium]|nr:SIS domain-containing protein [candidate division CSSED10-310 bacterium]
MTDTAFFQKVFDDSITCKSDFIAAHAASMVILSERILKQLREGRKLLIFGNGGSAADAQHLAAELVNRLTRRRRPAIPAIALTTDTSILTSIANDDEFSHIFSRQIEALGNRGDIALGISTSGNSPNLIRAVETARTLGLVTAGLLGGDGGKLKDLVECALVVPSFSAQRVQEIHITFCHALCEWIEKQLFPPASHDAS